MYKGSTCVPGKREKMNKYICECCGGHIDPYTMKCEYCGTQYKKENDVVYRIETVHSRVQTFKCAYNIPDEYLINYPKESSEMAIRHVAGQLASMIAPYCEYTVEDDPLNHKKMIYARIKIVEPINKGIIPTWKA